MKELRANWQNCRVILVQNIFMTLCEQLFRHFSNLFWFNLKSKDADKYFVWSLRYGVVSKKVKLICTLYILLTLQEILSSTCVAFIKKNYIYEANNVKMSCCEEFIRKTKLRFNQSNGYFFNLVLPAVDEGSDVFSAIKHFM